MSLLSLIGRLLKPRPRKQPRQPAVTPTVAKAAVPASKPKESAKSPAAATPHRVPRAPVVPAQPVRVTVRFIDQATNSPLHDPDVIDGLEGAPLQLNWRHFPGRLFTRAENFTDTFTAATSTITLFYQEVLAAPVSVYHRGSAGRLLAPPELIYGTVDMAFTVNALPDRTDDVIGAPSQQGVFSTAAQTVHFNYKEAGIEHGSLPEAAYVEVTVNKQVFARARSHDALAAFLPEGTVWQVFGLVREEVTHQVWLNLGGSQWITATHTRPHKQNPYLPAPTKLETPQLSFTADTAVLTATATVDGPSTGTRVWAAPYGRIQPETLTNGTAVHTTARLQLSNGSVWFQLDDGHYVQASYLHFPEKK